MAEILCRIGNQIGWRNENNTSGVHKLRRDGNNIGWRLNQDAGLYLHRDGNQVGWRHKSFATGLGTGLVLNTSTVVDTW